MPYEEGSKGKKKIKKGSYKDKAGMTKEMSVPHIDMAKRENVRPHGKMMK